MKKSISKKTALLVSLKKSEQVKPAAKRCIATLKQSAVAGTFQGKVPNTVGRVVQDLYGSQVELEKSIKELSIAIPEIDRDSSVQISRRSSDGRACLVTVQNPSEESIANLEKLDISEKVYSFIEYRGVHFTYDDYQALSGAGHSEKALSKFQEIIASFVANNFGFIVDLPDGSSAFSINAQGIEVAIQYRKMDARAEHRARLSKHKKFKIRCSQCAEFLHQTSEWFDPEVPTTGKMIKTFGVAKEGNWSLDFGSDLDTGLSLTCCNCNGYLVDLSTGKIAPQNLVPLAEKVPA